MIDIQRYKYTDDRKSVTEKQSQMCPDCGAKLVFSESSFYCPVCGFSQSNFVLELDEM